MFGAVYNSGFVPFSVEGMMSMYCVIHLVLGVLDFYLFIF